MFLDELCQVTVVPTFTQNDAFSFAFGMFGVADAELLPLRFTSALQVLVPDPQVVAALHVVPGLDSEQTYFLVLSPFYPLAEMCVAITSTGTTIKPQQIARYPCSFMTHLQKKTTTCQRGPGARVLDPIFS